MLFGLGRLQVLLGLVKQVRPAGWRRRTILTVEVGKPSRTRDARRVVWLNARDTAGTVWDHEDTCDLGCLGLGLPWGEEAGFKLPTSNTVYGSIVRIYVRIKCFRILGRAHGLG